MPDKQKVTMRPRENDAMIDYLSKIHDIPKERIVAAMLRRGIELEKTGDEQLRRIIKEEATEYHISRRKSKTGKRKVSQ